MVLVRLIAIPMAFFLTACSSSQSTPEDSAQEKRNNYDACVIDWFINNTTNTKSSTEYYRPYAEAACVNLLK
jgi:hypothetical protein